MRCFLTIHSSNAGSKRNETTFHNFYHAEITSVQRALQPITSHLPPTPCLRLHRCKDLKSFTLSGTTRCARDMGRESNFPLQSLTSRQGLSSQPPQMSQTRDKVPGPHRSKCGEQERALCTALGSGGGHSSGTGSLSSKQPVMVGAPSALWSEP